MNTAKVTEAPEEIWLNYGDIDRDCTHAECYSSGEVTWCQDKVFESDVRYVRADVTGKLAACEKSLRLVKRHALTAWSRGHRMGLLAAKTAASKFEVFKDDYMRAYEEMTNALLAADEEIKRLRAMVTENGPGNRPSERETT